MVLSMDRWRGKIAVVSGAGGGVGGEVVKKLIDNGLKVVGIDNVSEGLDDVSKKLANKQENLYTFTIDITQEEEVRNLFKKVTEELGPVHILVNCAGVFPQASLIEGEKETWRKILDVNVLGLCSLTSEAVKIMKENKIDGHIIHIGSVFGYRVPDMEGASMYAASKTGIRVLTESLRLEFNRLGLKIKVTDVMPGKIDSAFLEKNKVKFREEIEEVLKKFKGLEPGDVADAVMYALSTPSHVQVHELLIRPIGELY